MARVLYRRSDGVYAGSTTDDAAPLPHNPVTHVEVVVPVLPDRAGFRWDGGAGIRASTPAEIAAFHQAARNKAGDAEVEGQKALKSVVIWAAQRFGITPAQAKAEILAIYEAL